MHFNEYDYVLSIDEFERDKVFSLAHVLLSEAQAKIISKNGGNCK